MKTQINKKAISPFVAYVLLISMVVTLSVVVATWLYIQARSLPFPSEGCEGVSLSIEKIFCYDSGEEKIVNVTLKNRGRFTIEQVYVKADRFGELGEAYRFSLAKRLINLLPNGKYNYTDIYYSSRKIGLNKIKRIKFIPYIQKNLCSDEAVESATPQECSQA